MTLCVCTHLCMCNVTLLFSAGGLIRLACPQLHDVGKWGWQCLWSLMTKMHTHTLTLLLLHIQYVSCAHKQTHTHTNVSSPITGLKMLMNYCGELQELQERFKHLKSGLRGICAHSRTALVPWHTRLVLKPASQTVACDHVLFLYYTATSNNTKEL